MRIGGTVIEGCPNRDLLERMLLDDLPPAESGPMELHVASCPACQHVLETLTGDASPPDPGGTTSDGSEFLRRLIAQAPGSLLHHARR